MPLHSVIYTLFFFLHIIFLILDVAASDKIAEVLLKAEEYWVQRQKDPTLLLPHLEEHCEDLNQDVSMLVKKLYVIYGDLLYADTKRFCTIVYKHVDNKVHAIDVQIN